MCYVGNFYYDYLKSFYKYSIDGRKAAHIKKPNSFLSMNKLVLKISNSLYAYEVRIHIIFI